MKHLFIVNPVAGQTDHTDEIRRLVAANFPDRPVAAGAEAESVATSGSGNEHYEVYVTLAPHDATRKIIADAAVEDELRVYACGGDGTFNECVCGAALKENVAVCPFPTGTGNDFCRLFGDRAWLFQDLPALLEGSVRPIDLISCNGSYSANICSVGIDARIGTGVHDYTHFPLCHGAGAYVVSAAVNAFRGIATPMRVRCADYDREEKHSLVCVCNGRFYGGGFNPSPDAKLDDGLLEVFIVRKVSLFNFFRLIGLYAKGRADSLPRYITHLRATEVSVEFDREDVINLDGEALRAASVHMRLLPKALNLIVPRGLSSDAFS